MSGRVGSTDKDQALDAGADDYVTKPFNVEELLTRKRAATWRAALPSPKALRDLRRRIGGPRR